MLTIVILRFILGLSILQNSPFPRFLKETDLQEIFVKEQPGKNFDLIRKAFKDLGIYQVFTYFLLKFNMFNKD